MPQPGYKTMEKRGAQRARAENQANAESWPTATVRHHGLSAGRQPVTNNFHGAAFTNHLAGAIDLMVPARHPVFGRKNHVEFGNNNIVPDYNNVVPGYNNIVPGRDNVVKMKSDMAQNWKPLVFTLKAHLLTENGQKATVGVMESPCKVARKPRSRVMPVLTILLPVRRILKGFHHPAQGCAIRATLGRRES